MSTENDRGGPDTGEGLGASRRTGRALGRWTSSVAVKNHILYAFARLVLAVLQLLPTRLALKLGRVLGRLSYRLARRERQRAEGNLCMAMGELDARGRRQLLRRMFVHLGESVAECAQLPRLRKQLTHLVTYDEGSRRVLEKALEEGRGVLFVTGHLGNWELMAATLARLVPASVLYRPSYDPRFTRMLCRMRADSGIHSIDVTRPGHLGEAIGVLRKAEALGLLVDQPPATGRNCDLDSFLGWPALTSRLVPVLARRTGAAVVAGFSRRCGTCQHQVRIERLEDPSGWMDPRSGLRTITAPLEEAILRAPEQWAWSLDRWRGVARIGRCRSR